MHTVCRFQSILARESQCPSSICPKGAFNIDSPDPPLRAPTVVFVHGLLVDGELWNPVADELGRRGVRSYALDLPLGSHPVALRPDADVSPRGVGRLILAFLEALGLTDVTLVGNDTGTSVVPVRYRHR